MPPKFRIKWAEDKGKKAKHPTFEQRHSPYPITLLPNAEREVVIEQLRDAISGLRNDMRRSTSGTINANRYILDNVLRYIETDGFGGAWDELRRLDDNAGRAKLYTGHTISDDLTRIFALLYIVFALTDYRRIASAVDAAQGLVFPDFCLQAELDFVENSVIVRIVSNNGFPKNGDDVRRADALLRGVVTTMRQHISRNGGRFGYTKDGTRVSIDGFEARFPLGVASKNGG